MRSKWYEREEVGKITLDYVKSNCRYTKREKELMEIINERKLVRRDMLEIISPSYRNIGKNRTRLINKSLNKLFTQSCIDKVHEKQIMTKGNTPAIFSIDRAGSIILGQKHTQRIRQVKKSVGSKRYIHRELPLNFRHINGVNSLEVETINFCEDSDAEILNWSIEKECVFYYGQEKHVLIPDVKLSLKVNEKVYNIFLEYDTGSENIRYKEPPIIKNKILNYRKYKLSKIWENEFNNFPIVVLVTEDEKRTNFFNQKCKENGIIGVGVYRSNYNALLKRF